MSKYRCMNCSYKGSKLIYQLNTYSYCVASNKEEPEFIGDSPKWVEEKGFGDAEIGEPVACPKCHAWGVDKFEEV